MLCAQDIDAAYLFQDIGDIDDDLSSLLVPDLDFSGLNDMYTPSVKKPLPVQTGVIHAYLAFYSIHARLHKLQWLPRLWVWLLFILIA